MSVLIPNGRTISALSRTDNHSLELRGFLMQELVVLSSAEIEAVAQIINTIYEERVKNETTGHNYKV